jgi:hypothetical protein
VAGEAGRARGSGQTGKGAGGAAGGQVDDKGINRGDSEGSEQIRGEPWLMSHYTCLEENYGGTHYCPWGNLTASGLPVSPGVAACEPALLKHRISVSGFSFLCADTGSAVGPGVLDIWCYSFDHYGAPGTPEYEEACPAPCEVEIEGRCWARVRVVE